MPRFAAPALSAAAVAITLALGSPLTTAAAAPLPGVVSDSLHATSLVEKAGWRRWRWAGWHRYWWRRWRRY